MYRGSRPGKQSARKGMRIKMKTLMTFLALIVGVFMVGDMFLFSNVGRHNGISKDNVQDTPYQIGDVKFLKRQIKSGREFLSDGMKNFADKLYDEGSNDGDGNANSGEKYTGVRDSVLGAMDIPGMHQKFLPANVETKGSDVFGSEISKVRELERALVDGTLREEEIQNDPDEHENEIIEEDYATFDVENDKNEEEDVSTSDNKFSWINLFNFGGNSDKSEEAINEIQNDNSIKIDSPETVQIPNGDRLTMDAMNVPGMDDRILSKLKFQPENEDLFQMKEPTEEKSKSEAELEDEWLFEQMKDIRGLAESVPEWPADEKPMEPAVEEETNGATGKPTLSAYGFLASLFQPLQFAGSTGDDQDDGGWASVGELDNLADSVQRAIVPGMQHKMLAPDLAEMDHKLPAIEEQPPLEGGQEFAVAAVPGFSSDFFNKYGKLESDSQAAVVPVAPAAVPVASAAVPVASNTEQMRQQIPNDNLLVPQIPGLSDEFFQKFALRNPPDQPPSEQSYPAPLPSEQSHPAPINTDPIQVPNIPGLSQDFFDKYGGAQPSQAEEVPPVQPQDMKVPEVPGLSAEFFMKFIHPVAQGQAGAAVPHVDGMIAESLEEVPGLPDDFFNKYVKGKEVKEESVISAQGLRDQGFNMPDIPGLSDYLDKYVAEDGQASIPLDSLKESLLRAQLQVPGMPDKVIPEEGAGMAPNLPDFVPPSGIPELEFPEEEKAASSGQGLFALLMKAFVRSKEKTQLSALPVQPGEPQPGQNGSVPGVPSTAETAPEWPPREGAETAEEGFRLKNISEDIDIQEVMRALVPNFNVTVNDTNLMVKLDDAAGLLSQFEGVVQEAAAGIGGMLPMRPDLSAELANITALEDSRVVHCNLTKSPFWKVAITDRWHTVQDGLMFVYSSYMDDRIQGHTAIRILGILEGWEVGMHLKPFCQIWFQDKNAPYVIGATYEWLPGQPIAKFKAVLLTCVYQTDHVEGKPLAVSLTTEPCDVPKFLVKIHTRNETVGIKKTNFTICLTGPMKFGYADVGQFIQWMEFNIMMGVERFVLYNHSMDAALRPYLVHYAKLGYVQLFPWIIPDNIPNPLVFLKNLGHLAMINDCLYRNMWTSKHVIFMDIDEMILPRYGHVTFAPMLKNAGCDNKPQAVVQSVFFRREWPNDELYATNQTIVNMGLVGLLKTKRERKIWPPYMRSKYFIKPDEVLICNVHAAHSFLSPLDYQDLSCIFNPKEVIMHHYRYWGEVTGNYVIDRRLHEYGDDLIRRASSIYEAVLGQKVT